MTATPDLTLAQIHAKCTSTEVATYIASMAVLPINVTVCEFLAIFLQACAVAQITANNDNTSAEKGERLNAYPLPVTGTVETDTTLNLQSFASTYKLNVVTAVNGNAIVPDYI
ncbi:hypothetical protein [Nostoc sp. CALU 1950]|uniref:hypothetical protein n=1 Tax=Nostoc sp. CALU 1950 TaxID=3104321 RepID=UPI003EB9B720